MSVALSQFMDVSYYFITLINGLPSYVLDVIDISTVSIDLMLVYIYTDSLYMSLV